ncbi:MAG: 3-deoxy-D-manno-octulosonic acid transferase [Victivallaceae bacterium]
MKTAIKQWILLLLYEIGLIIALFISLPKLVKKVFLYGKYKRGFKYRFGFGFPKTSPGKQAVWFHGASVGEIRLLEPLFRELRERYRDFVFVVTACSEAGVTEIKRLFGSDAHVFLFPLDSRFIINRVIKRIAPKLLILSEGDYWFNFIRGVKKTGGKIVVVNGKISETSFKRYLRVKKFASFFFAHIDLICTQDNDYKSRFLSMGFPENKVEVTGNIKLSNIPVSDRNTIFEWTNRLGISENDFVFILGSTHASDEAVLLPVLAKLKTVFSDLRIILVPRHIERALMIKQQVESYGLKVKLWTSEHVFFGSCCDVVIVDVIGMLSSLYSLAHLAFVGGTFDQRIGGHNLLEPIMAGVPVCFGPFTFSQSEIADKIKAYSSETVLTHNHQDVLIALTLLLENEDLRRDLVNRGFCFLQKQNENDPLKLTQKCIERFIPLYGNH